jgi:hypothetical protein
MTVSSTTNRKTYAGNGVTTSFATSPVVFFDTSDLVITVVTDSTGASEALVENTDYTVSGGAGSTGTVSLAGGSSPYGAPATGTTVVIRRVLPLTQDDDFLNNDINDAEVLEDRLDRLTMIDQQIDEEIGRSLKVPSSEGEQADIVVAGKAGYYLRRNVAGTAFELAAGDINTSTFTQSGTGAVERSVTAKLGETINVRDFGAVGDGVTDDTVAFQTACDALDDYQTLWAQGEFLLSQEVFIKRSNNTYDFRSAKFIMSGAVYTGYGSGFFIGDPTAKTTRPENITILGGEYYPAGNNAAYPLADFNPIAVAIGERITIDNPKVFPKQSTRAISLQTVNTYGDGVNPNIQNVRVVNLEVYGDGDAVDGVDITAAGADGLIQDVYIQGFISGCKRSVNISSGSNSYNFVGIDIDIVGRGASEVGLNFLRVKKSKVRAKLLDVTKAGAVLQQIDDVDAELMITGTGAGLTTALNVVEASEVVNQSRVNAMIEGAFTTGITPQHNDVIYPNVQVDGATTGIDVSGFRSTWGLVVLKNCTTTVDNLALATDKWGLVITQGAGANPVVIKRESDFVTTFTDTDATPSVLGATFCRTVGTTAITAFDDGVDGQRITILADQNITITQGASIKLAGGANFAMTALDTLTLVQYGSNVWAEVARSVTA